MRVSDWGSEVCSSDLAGEAFADLRGRLSGYAPRAARDHAYWRGAPCSMLIDEVETIWTAIDTRDDWRPFDAKIVTIREMGAALAGRSEEHTSELQSLMRISYAVFCLTKKKNKPTATTN